ncbi:hypothetical protein CONPUDRAFT_155813 [Coniophora puteana RWD-64-598 SS2]|uniref:Uncharacterized protein n=1 Tax=Coniophora puteana (strain RWD-64-598) TaxID=741705 RepID=A0A5M3MIT7_CONPW|nr:uncharacterized protein CONPUDRAFT_155813 [Coniophora puteana RWD-64-598 SS2]EIW79132.1 hypothetical protein CONPUDRAFT_155813 [Coniophora puteana RWD-64-598 SS2]
MKYNHHDSSPIICFVAPVLKHSPPLSFMKPSVPNQPHQAGVNQSTSSPSDGAGAPVSNAASNRLVPILDAHDNAYVDGFS